MSFKPIYGYSGDHPVPDFPGVKPVSMESPCPFIHGELQITLESYCAASGNAAAVKIVSSGTQYVGIGCEAWQPRLYKGVANLALTLSASSFFSNAGTNYSCLVSAYIGDPNNGGTFVSSLLLGWDDATSSWKSKTGSFPVPYYRYRFYVVITGNFGPNYDAIPAGEWVELAIEEAQP